MAYTVGILIESFISYTYEGKTQPFFYIEMHCKFDLDIHVVLLYCLLLYIILTYVDVLVIICCTLYFHWYLSAYFIDISLHTSLILLWINWILKSWNHVWLKFINKYAAWNMEKGNKFILIQFTRYNIWNIMTLRI